MTAREPVFVGPSRIALVDGLAELVRRTSTEPVPRWVSLEAPSGWGKTRVARELYVRLAADQGSPAYWPTSILASAEDTVEDVSARRKRLNPDVLHAPGSLPSFAWWGISCTSRHGIPSVALAQDIAVFESHAAYLEDAWRRLPRSARFAADARGLLAAAVDEVSMEAGGRAIEAAIGTAVPGLGLARWVAEWGWAKRRDRRERSERLESSSAISADHGAIGDAVVEMVLRLARPGLPMVLVVEDLHDADPLLVDVLDRIASGTCSVLLVTTGWPGHLEESAALTAAMERAGERLIRISSESSQPLPEPFPPHAGLAALEPDSLGSILRHYFADVDPWTADRLVERYPNPLALELFCQIPLYRRRFGSQRLQLTDRDIAALPTTVRDLYRRLWDELPEPVRAALAIATLGIPAAVDPEAGRSPLWNTALMADALRQLGLPNQDEIAAALGEAPTAYAWARVITEALRRFVEPDQLQVAAEDRAQYVFPDEVETIHRAVVAQLVPRLTSDGERPVEEQEHDARLLLALHAEGFVDDGAYVAVAADTLVGLLREDLTEVAERLRLARLGLRCCDPLSEVGLRLRIEEIRALTRLERVPEAEELIGPLRHDLGAIAGPTSRAAIELDADAAWMLREVDHRGAIDLARATFERAADALGPDDRLTLQAANVLAAALEDAGRIVEAVDLSRHILDRRQATFPPDDRETLLAAANLAYALRRAGRLSEAEPLAIRTLAARDRALGPMHPDTIQSRRELAHIHQQAGRPADELELRRQVAADNRAVLGATHPQTLWALGDLQAALERAGRTQEAIAVAEERVSLAHSGVGTDAPLAWDIEAEVASLLGRLGYGARALDLHQQVVDRVRAARGPDHPQTIRFESWARSTALAEQGPRAVIPAMEELASRARRALPPEHPDRLGVLQQLGFAYWRSDRNDEAEPLLEEVLAARRHHQPFDLQAQTDTLLHLAECWIEAGRAEEGRPRLEEQLEAWRAAVGDAAEATLRLRLCIARLLFTADPDAARAMVGDLDRYAASMFPVAHSFRIQLRANVYRFEDARDQAAGAAAEFGLITDLVDAVGLAHPDTIGQLESFSMRTDSELLDRVVRFCLDALPQVREQAGHGSRAHRQVLWAASNAALSRSRDAEVVDVRRELVEVLSSDPDVDPEQLCRARTLLGYGLVLGDDGGGTGLEEGMDVLRRTLVDAEPVLAPHAESVLAARRLLAIFSGTVLGLWDEALTHRLAVLEALAAAPEPDPAAAEQARADLAQALEDADLPGDHVVRIAAVAALADTA